MLVEKRAPAFALDHEVLLPLFGARASSKGLRVKEILDSPELAPYVSKHFKAMTNPYTSLGRILARNESGGLCRNLEGRWYPPRPGAEFEKEPRRVTYRGMSPVMRSFLNCQESRCQRDHFPDLILSDYVLRLMPKHGDMIAVYRLVSRVIVWEAARARHLDLEFMAWKGDVMAHATERGVRERDLPEFQTRFNDAIAQLRSILGQGTLVDRIQSVNRWIVPDRRLWYFLSRDELRNLLRWVTVASPTFWRFAFSTIPIQDADFSPIHLTLPSGETMRLRNIGPSGGTFVENFKDRVQMTVLSLATIWLKRDWDHLSKTASRLHQAGARISYTQEVGPDGPGFRIVVTQRASGKKTRGR